MATNPLIAQGTLNRLRGSVVWADFPNLNVTASFLNKEGIRLGLEGEATTYIQTITGAVTSPEPYMMVSLTMNLLKTNGLAELYRQQMLVTTVLGNATVISDTTALGNYALLNTSIESVREMDFAGTDAGFSVVCKGYYPINSKLWDLL